MQFVPLHTPGLRHEYSSTDRTQHYYQSASGWPEVGKDEDEIFGAQVAEIRNLEPQRLMIAGRGGTPDGATESRHRQRDPLISESLQFGDFRRHACWRGGGQFVAAAGAVHFTPARLQPRGRSGVIHFFFPGSYTIRDTGARRSAYRGWRRRRRRKPSWGFAPGRRWWRRRFRRLHPGVTQNDILTIEVGAPGTGGAGGVPNGNAGQREGQGDTMATSSTTTEHRCRRWYRWIWLVRQFNSGNSLLKSRVLSSHQRAASLSVRRDPAGRTVIRHVHWARRRDLRSGVEQAGGGRCERQLLPEGGGGEWERPGNQ